MKLELIVIGITAFLIINTYKDGKYTNIFTKYQKYYKMAFITFVGLCVYLYLKRSPQHAKEFFTNANGYIKYLPVDRNTTSMVAPYSGI